jgi:serine/threonine protein kinase
MVGCLNESTLGRLRDQQLTADDRARVVDHLDDCTDCRRRALAFTIDEQARTTGIQQRTASSGTASSGTASSGNASSGSASSGNASSDAMGRKESSKPSGPALWAGESVDHFEVKLMLGRGAMGEVYLARDTKLGRKVALKLLRPEMFDSSRAISRFQHEARAMARINHPNVVTIHAVGDHRGVPYVAMEFVRGESLYERLDGGQLEVDDVLRITIGITSALRQAHELGVVHRDLKPENVIASRDGEVRVLDFGLAKMLDIAVDESFAPTPIPDESEIATRVGARVGTPLYMAPEQWRCEAITDATDMWALGIMMHEMLCGRAPFRGADMADLARKVCNADEPAPVHESISGPLREVVTACLNRDPAQRPSANEVLTSLRAVQEARLAPAQPLSIPEPLPPAPSQRRGLWMAIGGITLLAGGVVLGMMMSSDSPSESAQRGTLAPVSAAAPSEQASAPSAKPEPVAQASAPPMTSASAASSAATPKPRRPPTSRRRTRRKPKDPFSKAPTNAGF